MTTIADGSGKAPLTFQLHDCYGTGYGMNDTETVVGGWKSSKMRTEYLPSILALMPESVKNGIREVSKKNAATASSIVTSADKLFLLSEIEIFGSWVDIRCGRRNAVQLLYVRRKHKEGDERRCRDCGGSGRRTLQAQAASALSDSRAAQTAAILQICTA